MSDFLQQLMPQPGERIADRYRIERVLGEGGFGVVYLARQENLDREVAIKMLLPAALADRTAVQRFQREVDLVRRLEHPHTVRIFDRGETPKGLQFYVMEFVKGRSLGEVLHTYGPLNAARARAIAEQVLMSLGEAHEKGIVHRDLKPGNIMLAEVFGRGDFVKVLDFGIGKLVAGADTEGITTRGIIGTPFYMSPEQVKAATDLDGRSDLYALGLIIHEMLTSRRAIDGPSPLEVVMAHLKPEPVVLDPAVANGPLGEIVLRATQKDRNVRYQSALEMLQALQAVPLEDPSRVPSWQGPTPRGMAGPVLTPPSFPQSMPHTPPRVIESHTMAASGPQPAPARKSRALMAILAVVVLAAVGVGVVVALGGGEEEPRPTATEPPAQGTERESEPAGPAAGTIAEQAPGAVATPEGPVPGADAGPTPRGQVAGIFSETLEQRRRGREAVNTTLREAHRLVADGRRVGRMAAEVWAEARLTGAGAADAGASSAPDVAAAPSEPDGALAALEEPLVDEPEQATAEEPPAAEPETPPITATIRGTPASARVRVGDETVCRRLPCEVTLPPGEDEVRARVTADGYRSETIRLRREPGRSYSVELWREYR